MNWDDQLEGLMAVARCASAEDLPRFLGDLECVRAFAWQRLTVPVPTGQQSPDQYVDVYEAARRLSVSVKYLYTNHHRFRFTRHLGRRLLFSAAELDSYMRRNGAKGPLSQ